MSGAVQVRRARHDDVATIGSLVKDCAQGRHSVDEVEITEWLFSRGVMVAQHGDSIVAVAAWQTENLLSVTDVLYISPALAGADVGRMLLEAVEREACLLMCEANVVPLLPGISREIHGLLQNQGYERMGIDQVHRIWREVLAEFATEDTVLLVKPLRERMIMVPL